MKRKPTYISDFFKTDFKLAKKNDNAESEKSEDRGGEMEILFNKKAESQNIKNNTEGIRNEKVFNSNNEKYSSQDTVDVRKENTSSLSNEKDCSQDTVDMQKKKSSRSHNEKDSSQNIVTSPEHFAENRDGTDNEEFYSEEELEEDTETQDKDKKKRKNTQKRKQRFRQLWLLKKEFSGWLKAVSGNDFKAKCTYCNLELNAELFVLNRHRESTNHIINEKAKGAQCQKKIVDYSSESIQFNERVKVTEIKMVGLLIEHHIQMKFMDHFSEFAKNVFALDPVVKDIHLKRTKATSMAVNVIGEAHKIDLCTRLQTRKFSILSDESTDIGTVKNICIMVRYFDEHEKAIRTKFFELAKVFEFDNAHEGATAEHLYNVMQKSFKERNIPEKNLTGFGADNCSVNMGCYNSISTRLKRDFPGIKIIGCVCHSMHLVGSEACKKLPRRLEDLARNVYSFFSSSSKRICEFAEFEIFVQMNPLKLLHPSQTRWLSLKCVIERLLELWTPLTLFFENKRFEENFKLVSVENIYTNLKDPFVKLYFLFLDWILYKLVGFNEYFQNSKVVIHELHERLRDLYRDILLAYLKRDYVHSSDLSAVDPAPKITSNYKPYNNMYLGVSVRDYIDNLLKTERLEKSRSQLASKGALQPSAQSQQPPPVRQQQQTPVRPQHQTSVRPQQQTPVRPQHQTSVRPEQQTPVRSQHQTSVRPQQQTPVRPQQQTPVRPQHQATFQQQQQLSATQQRLEEFFFHCQQFLQTAACEMRSRYDFDDPILSKLSWLGQKNALSANFREKCESLCPLMNLVPRIVTDQDTKQKIDDQWRKLPYAGTFKEEIENNLEVDYFWFRVRDFKNEANENPYFELGDFALDILSLPHSNADCERAFWKINAVKTDLRNRLITSTVNGFMLAEQCIKENGGNCISFEPTKAMLKRMKANILYPPKKTAEANESAAEELENDLEKTWDVVFDDDK